MLEAAATLYAMLVTMTFFAAWRHRHRITAAQGAAIVSIGIYFSRVAVRLYADSGHISGDWHDPLLGSHAILLNAILLTGSVGIALWEMRETNDDDEA